MSTSKSITPEFELVAPPHTLETYAYKGFSAALRLDSDILFVITAPSMEVLKKVWDMVCPDTKLDESKTKCTVGEYRVQGVHKVTREGVERLSKGGVEDESAPPEPTGRSRSRERKQETKESTPKSIYYICEEPDEVYNSRRHESHHDLEQLKKKVPKTVPAFILESQKDSMRKPGVLACRWHKGRSEWLDL